MVAPVFGNESAIAAALASATIHGSNVERMLRRATAASATLALAALAVACGRQVTPEPTTNGNLTGKMAITFRTNGPLDFTNVEYQIVINTCGTGEPYPNPKTTSYQNYSYIFQIGQNAGNQALIPQLFQIVLVQGSSSGLTEEAVPGNGSLESLQYNFNGQPNQFQLVFDRAQLANPLGVAQPCPGQTQVTPSPSASATSAASPSPSAGVSPGASPSVTPSAGVTPSPSPSPSPSPAGNPGTTPTPYATTPAQANWYINFFTVQNQVVQDSLGSGGPSDTSYFLPIDTTTQNTVPIQKISGAGAIPVSTAAQLSGGEIENYP
jgi:hypothetical protein